MKCDMDSVIRLLLQVQNSMKEDFSDWQFSSAGQFAAAYESLRQEQSDQICHICRILQDLQSGIK